jgi:hypothetical protein
MKCKSLEELILEAHAKALKISPEGYAQVYISANGYRTGGAGGLHCNIFLGSNNPEVYSADTVEEALKLASDAMAKRLARNVDQDALESLDETPHESAQEHTEIMREVGQHVQSDGQEHSEIMEAIGQ